MIHSTKCLNWSLVLDSMCELSSYTIYYCDNYLILQPLILRPKKEATDEPTTEDDELVYADSDYRDLYAYGPVSYKQTSQNAAQTKKEEMAKRHGTIQRK